MKVFHFLNWKNLNPLNFPTKISSDSPHPKAVVNHLSAKNCVGFLFNVVVTTAQCISGHHMQCQCPGPPTSNLFPIDRSLCCKRPQ